MYTVYKSPAVFYLRSNYDNCLPLVEGDNGRQIVCLMIQFDPSILPHKLRSFTS